jgi:hypothetical protein
MPVNQHPDKIKLVSRKLQPRGTKAFQAYGGVTAVCEGLIEGKTFTQMAAEAGMRLSMFCWAMNHKNNAELLELLKFARTLAADTHMDKAFQAIMGIKSGATKGDISRQIQLAGYHRYMAAAFNRALYGKEQEIKLVGDKARPLQINGTTKIEDLSDNQIDHLISTLERRAKEDHAGD